MLYHWISEKSKILSGQGIQTVRILMYLVNLITIAYLSLLISNATNLICARYDARIFLERLQYIPINPERVKVVSLGCFLALIVLGFSRNLIGKKKNNALHFLLFFVDIALCVGIMYHLNMSNKGLLMIPAMHAITFVNGKIEKIISLCIVLILFIVLDQDFISASVKLVSINTFIEYYSAPEKLRMVVFRNVLYSLNEVLFIFYMVLDIQMQIAERKRIQDLNEQLNKSLEKLRLANIQLEEYARKSEDMAKLKERNRLAREIHDTIGHTLTGIELGLKACLCFTKDQIGEVFVQVEKVYRLAQKGSQDVRYSLKELRPDALQRYSLLPALNSLVKQMNECTPCRSFLILEDEIPSLAAVQEELVYRIVQESLTNAISHGGATEIEVRIGFDGVNLCISICDNGKGSDSLFEGFGLTNIRQRVEYFMGTVQVITAAGKGFVLHVSIPLTRSSQND